MEIRPEIQVAADGAGQGRAVQVTVVDARRSPGIGQISTADLGPEMTTKGDLAAIVRAALADGLARRGFVPTASKAAGTRELRVKIVSLDYGIAERTTGSSTLQARSALRSGCIRDSGLQAGRTHEGEVKEQIFITAQDEAANSRHLSRALSQALNSVLADRQLIDCLAK